MANNTITYALRENLLTADPDDCMGRNLRLLTEFAIGQTRAKYHGEFLHSKNSVSTRSVRQMVKRGTPLISTSFSITGVFANKADSFDKNCHAIKLNVNAGPALKEAAAQARTQKVETPSTGPYITTITDKVTGDSGTIKAGSVMEITGSRLKFDPSDAEQGVFALTAGGAVRCETVIENKPARLLVMLPASMEAGDFTVEVRTRVLSKTLRASKTLKRGTFGKTLTAIKG